MPTVLRAVCAAGAVLFAVTSDAPRTPRAHEIAAMPTCLDGRVTFEGTDEIETELICRGVSAAATVLARCGLTAVPRVTVETASTLIDPDGFARRGEFVPSAARIRLQPFATFIASNPASLAGVPVSHASLYAGIAAHEMAHAIFAAASAPLELVPTAHEYVAYAVEMATLPAAVREAVATSDPSHSRSDLLVFSPFLLYADPDRFALAAWRHFNAPGKGCSVIRSVLDGAIHFPPPGD